MLQSQFYSPERIQPPQNPHFRYPDFQKKFGNRPRSPDEFEPCITNFNPLPQKLGMRFFIHPSVSENHPPKLSL